MATATGQYYVYLYRAISTLLTCCSRAAAYTKAMTALSTLNNTEKVNIVTGSGWEKGPCVGNTGAVPSIGFPALCLQDSPLG